MKISRQGADVDVSKVVLHWNNRPDETVTNVGIMKEGGETAGGVAPGHEGTLTGSDGQRTGPRLNKAPTAKVMTLWGYD